MDGNFTLKILEMSTDAETALKAAHAALLSSDEALWNATPSPPAGLNNRAQRKWRRAYLTNDAEEVARLNKVAMTKKKLVAREEHSHSGQVLAKGSCSGLRGKGGILAPPGLSTEEQEIWRREHNERWKAMPLQERIQLQQQQFEEQRSNRRTIVLKTAQQDGSRAAGAGSTQTRQVEELGKNETRKRAHSPESIEIRLGDDASDEDIKYDPATQTLHKERKRCVDDTAPAMATDTVDEAVELSDGMNSVDETQYDPVISVTSEANFKKYVVDSDGHPVTQFDFGPLFEFSDAHVEEILRKGPEFTRNVIQITAGNLDLRQPLTDEGLMDLVAACPRLEGLSIHGGSNITDDSLSVVLEHCPSIRHIALCGADFEPNNMSGWPLLEAIQGSAATLLEKIALMNTAVAAETVLKLRGLRPGLRISARG